MTNTTAPIDLCICGANTATGQCDAAHWFDGQSSALVAFSCSPVCGARIEELRNARGRLTTEMVTKARQVVLS